MHSFVLSYDSWKGLAHMRVRMEMGGPNVNHRGTALL